MAKAQPSEKQQAAVETEKQFPVKLRIYMKPYELEDKSGISLTAELIEPFPAYAEDFTNIRVMPRWDRDAALFKFRMGLYLKTSDDIMITGVCKLVSYESKRPSEKGKMIYYPGLFFKLPYRDELVEFGFKKRKETDSKGHVTYSDPGDSYVFRDLASELWGGSFEPGIGGSVIDESAEG